MLQFCHFTLKGLAREELVSNLGCMLSENKRKFHPDLSQIRM